MLASSLWLGDGHLEHTIAPVATGLLVGALSFALTEFLARRSITPTVVYLGSFALLWALTQLITGFFPVVESHNAAIYFGDVVTLTVGESFFFFVLASLSSLYLALNWRRLAERAFLASIFETPFHFRHPIDLSFYLLALLLLCFSVQLLGLLFTLSCLFLPTAVYGFSGRTGVGRHLARVSAAAALAALVGFSWSLADPRLLTTPFLSLLLAALPALHLAAERLFRCK
jgi:ABC-type Mn2+/Zn2+ transport system permease subunit